LQLFEGLLVSAVDPRPVPQQEGKHAFGRAAQGRLQDPGFDRQQAVQTPACGGHGLHQIHFGLVGGLEAVNIGGAVPVEFSGVLAGDDYLLRTESVAEAVA
jgi:hypothetical protein